MYIFLIYLFINYLYILYLSISSFIYWYIYILIYWYNYFTHIIHIFYLYGYNLYLCIFRYLFIHFYVYIFIYSTAELENQSYFPSNTRTIFCCFGFFFPWFPWWKIRIRPELVLIARGKKKNQDLCCFLWRNINIQSWLWRGNPERKNPIVFLSKGENKGDFILERRAKIQRFKAEAEFDRNSCLVQLIANFPC